MTNQKRLFFILGLLVLAVICYRFGRPAPEKREEAKGEPRVPKQEPASPTDPPPSVSRAEMLRNRTPSPDANLDQRVARYTDGSTDLADAVTLSGRLHQSPTPHEDLEVLAQLFVYYQVLFQANPVGTENFEFTTALTGDNAKKVNFIDPDSPALTSANELVDRWGSPFVFHPLSGTKIGIRSHGPDKVLWTEDDLTLDN